jgi:phage N-6-adenine-methyltransferase
VSALVALPPAGALSIERAREMIAACRNVDEAKDIADKAAAVQVYLRASGAALHAQNDAAEIALRAQRRMGEMLAETDFSKGGRPPKTPGAQPVVSVPTLAALGVSEDESRRAQRLAAVPASEFDSRIAVVRDASAKLTHAALVGKGVKTQSASEQCLRTPRWLFDVLSEKFGPFALDAYASSANALCEKFFTAETDANAQPWEDATFANPPFDDMGSVFAKAVAEQARGVRSVIVSPVGCSQRWYHELAIQGTVFVPDLRVNFDNVDGSPTSSADRDTIVVVFGRGWRNQDAGKGVFRVRRLVLRGGAS